MPSEDVDLDNDVDLDLDLDGDMDLDNDYASRAVENAIRGCGPCSPDPEPAGGGGHLQYVVFFSKESICSIYLLH